MTTNSSWPVTLAAAAITCSNSSRRTSPHLAHDASPFRLAQQSGERRVLAQVISVRAFFDECALDLRDWAIEQLLPPVCVVIVDMALLAPAKEDVSSFVNHRATKSAGERLVIGEAARPCAIVRVPLTTIARWRKVNALGGGALAFHRGSEYVPTWSIGAVRFDSLEKVKERRHRHVRTPRWRIHDRHAPFADPPVERRVAHAEDSCCEPARHRLAKLTFERRSYLRDVGVSRQLASGTAEPHHVLEQLSTTVDDAHSS